MSNENNQSRDQPYTFGDWSQSIRRDLGRLEHQVESLHQLDRTHSQNEVKLEQVTIHILNTLKELNQECKDRRNQIDGLSDNVRLAIQEESEQLRVELKEIFKVTEDLEGRIASIESQVNLVNSRQGWIVAIASTVILFVMGSGIIVFHIGEIPPNIPPSEGR